MECNPEVETLPQIDAILRPITRFTQSVGFTFTCVTEHSSDERRVRRRCRYPCVYSIILNVLYWVDLATMVPCFMDWKEINVSMKLTKVLFIMLQLLAILASTNALVVLPRELPKFLYTVKRLNSSVRNARMVRKYQYFVRVVMIYLVVVIGTSIPMWIYFIVSYDRGMFDMHCLMSPFSNESPFLLAVAVPRVVIMNVLNVGLSLFLVHVWFGVIVVKCDISILIDEIVKLIKQEENRKLLTFDDVQKLYDRYKTIVDISHSVNAMGTFVIGLFYAAIVPSLCLVIYSLSINELGVVTKIENIVAVSSLGITAVVMTIVSINLYETGQTILGNVSRLELTTMDSRTISLFHVFVCRLRREEICLTALGFFVINRESALMLIGTVVTYAVIVFQFSPTLPDHLNCIARINCTVVD